MRSVVIAVVLLAAGCCAQQSNKPQKQQVEDPCQNKARVVSDATYCDRYWECVNGQPELYDCPNGLVFAGKHRGVTEGCDYPWRANYCEEKQLANGPISTEHCDWLYGIFGHESSCTRYWTCWNGTATEQLCIGGLLYNEDTHSCDWPDNVDGCQKHPLCVDDANGNVPLGKSCNRYWQCQGGYPRLQRCPAMLVFDKQSLRCVVPPTEDCDIPTTPAPSPEDADEDRNRNGNEDGDNGSQNYPQQAPIRQQPRPQQQQQQQQQQQRQQAPQQQQQQQQQQQRQQAPQQQQRQQSQREQVQVVPNQQNSNAGRTSGTINIHVPPGAIPLPVRPGSGSRARNNNN